MTRLHIHMNVSADHLEQSTKFYSALLGTKPTKQKPDYVKWMLDDPRINFVISARCLKAGLNHLGIQAENESEMVALRERIRHANLSTFHEDETACCFAKSDKIWVQDPNHIAWETFHTTGETEVFGESSAIKGACCIPQAHSECHSFERKSEYCG